MCKFPRQACVHCHFFIWESRGPASGDVWTSTVPEQERKQARAADYSWHKNDLPISCYFGVWDQGYNFDGSKKHELLTQTDRRGFCFFWKYRPGMLIPAAEVLQKRDAEARAARVDRLLTIVGLWIAAFALLASTFVQLARGWSWWCLK